MKKMISIALVMGMLLLLNGCGESEKVISGNVNNANKTSSEATEASSEAKDVSSETVQPAADVKGYVFVSKDVNVVIDAEAAPIVEALGEPASYFEAASCAFEGLDKIYTYSGFEINTYPMEDVDYVSSVIIKDDSVTTPEGVAIGDTKDKIEKAYGTDCVVEGNLITYEKDDMKLRFILSDDVIQAIEYVSNVL